MIADEQVEIAVAVDIRQRGKRTTRADHGNSKGIGAFLNKGRRQRRPDVAEKNRAPIRGSDQEVEITVAVKVRQHRRSLAPQREKAEWVGADQCEGWIRRAHSTPHIPQSAPAPLLFT